MAKRRSIRAVVAEAKRQEVRDVKAAGEPQLHGATIDSFVNFAHKLGVGADNPMSSSTYGYNPITRNRTMLEWIHRGSWLGGIAVDAVAEDMTRMGCTLRGTLKPAAIDRINEVTTNLSIWSRIKETIQWARLYGGAIAFMLIDGQAPETPLRLDTISKGQFKGLLVLDRWMVQPSLEDLVTDYGPALGQPKFYTVTAQGPALPGVKIHYSRVLRLEGVSLPYWQRLTENLWGLSIIERLYDRMIAFDSATTGAAQLVYKAYLRTVKIRGLREVVAAGGVPMQGLTAYMDMMRRFQGIEGLTLLDADDSFETLGHSAFGGLAEALVQFGQQLSGALQIPLVRLFGQSPAGFSTGDTDLRLYYDSIKQQQMKDLQVPMTKIYRAIAQSEGIALPEGFGIDFNSLWQLSATDKVNIAATTTTSVIQAQEAGLISDQIAMKELRQSSMVTGVFSNITDEDIEAASDDIGAPPDASEVMGEPDTTPSTPGVSTGHSPKLTPGGTDLTEPTQ